MTDYISRADAKAAFCREIGYNSPRAALAADLIFDAIPAVDVRPVVRGAWRFCGSDRWNDYYECSCCGKNSMDDSRFCPNCGADMRDEQYEVH